MVPGAVLLIDEDRVGNFVHHDILEMHIGGNTLFRGSRPCFHSHAVGCASESAILNEDTHNRFFIRILTETPHADAVARPTGHSFDVYLLAAIANRDTIVSGLYGCIYYFDTSRAPNVDSISVSAVSRRSYGEVLEGKVLAAQNIDMKVLAVKGSYVLDDGIGDKVEP